MEQLVILPNNTSGVVFLDGWADDVEGVGIDAYRWTTAITAKIKIPVINRASAKKPYQLSINAIPYCHRNGPSYQDLILYLDGYFLTQIRLTDSGITEGQVFLPSLNSASLDSYSILSFALPNGAVPANHGNGTDLRTLGIGLRRLGFTKLN